MPLPAPNGCLSFFGRFRGVVSPIVLLVRGVCHEVTGKCYCTSEVLESSPDSKNRLGMKFLGLTLVCLLSTMFTVAACDGGEHAPMATGAVEWGYDGAGAAGSWSSLSEEYATCADGDQQSPIDITTYEKGDGGPILFSYGSDTTAVRNDGKFVHIDYAPGSTLSFGRRIFELKSAHLHSPSEHRIGGVGFAAELHLVHEHAEGHLVVVALLLRLGEPSPLVQAILNAAPTAGDTIRGAITHNIGGYVTGELGYYQYDGSKTTPPCHEPVGWLVMRELKTISLEQVNKLLALSGGANNRPVQPTGSRVITIGGTP